MATVKEIFERQGYKYDKDGRNRIHRSLQSLLDSGLITFNICKAGHVWVNADGFKYNLSCTIKVDESRSRRWYHKSSITTQDGYTVLKFIGQVLQTPIAKEILSSYVDIDSTCKECGGRVIIPAFHYYCNGVCFDCYGLGYNRKFKPTVQITV